MEHDEYWAQTAEASKGFLTKKHLVMSNRDVGTAYFLSRGVKPESVLLLTSNESLAESCEKRGITAFYPEDVVEIVEKHRNQLSSVSLDFHIPINKTCFKVYLDVLKTVRHMTVLGVSFTFGKLEQDIVEVMTLESKYSKEEFVKYFETWAEDDGNLTNLLNSLFVLYPVTRFPCTLLPFCVSSCRDENSYAVQGQVFRALPSWTKEKTIKEVVKIVSKGIERMR